jgi:hypothetical protein
MVVPNVCYGSRLPSVIKAEAVLAKAHLRNDAGGMFGKGVQQAITGLNDPGTDG